MVNKHIFLGEKEGFAAHKNAYLNKALIELDSIIPQFKFYGDLEQCSKKEVTIGVISFLIRKCIELRYIEPSVETEPLNSMIHVHECYFLANGGISLRSDWDRKKEKSNVVIDSEYLNKLREKIVEWRKESIS